MGQYYSQLTEGERNQFYALQQAEMPMTEIANQLGRSRTTLYNELNRNRGGRGYRPRQAQQVAEKRRAEKVQPLKILKCTPLQTIPAQSSRTHSNPTQSHPTQSNPIKF